MSVFDINVNKLHYLEKVRVGTKVIFIDTKMICETCSKLTIKTEKQFY